MTNKDIKYDVNCGFEGMVFDVCLSIGNKFSSERNPYSFVTYGNIYIPVKVIKEYPRFFTCEVLPHFNANEGIGISKPYIITIDKHDVYVGNIIIKGIESLKTA